MLDYSCDRLGPFLLLIHMSVTDQCHFTDEQARPDSPLKEACNRRSIKQRTQAVATSQTHPSQDVHGHNSLIAVAIALPAQVCYIFYDLPQNNLVTTPAYADVESSYMIMACSACIALRPTATL